MTESSTASREATLETPPARTPPEAAPLVTSVKTRASGAPWNAAQLAGFRLLFAYIVLYALPSPFDLLPFTDAIFSKWDSTLWYRIVPFLSEHVFRLHADLSIKPAGSGDTTFNYVELLCQFTLALTIAALWSAIDRKRTDYAWLSRALRIYVRYVLAAALLSYGSVKVLKTQFPMPDGASLLRPLGRLSPMGLLWTFMGASTPYTFFGGVAEIVPGLLLLFRRTTTLGALLAMGVLANVVMLNFSYDVPVKLYSTHLFLFATYLAAPDLGRLADFFVLDRATAPVPIERAPRSRRATRALVALKTLAIGWMFFAGAKSAYAGWREWGDGKPVAADDGVFAVESFVRDGETIPPLLTDSTRWQHVYMFDQRFGVRGMDWKWRWFTAERKAGSRTLVLKPDEEKAGEASTLTYALPDPRHITIEGTFDGKRVDVRAERKDASSFELTSRGFHWINETPYNR